MSNFKVLVTARSFGTADSKALELLEQKGCEVFHLRETPGNPLRSQLEEHIPEADAIIAGLESYDSDLLSLTGKLKVISRYGVGHDAIDKEAAGKQNIKIAITPGANSDSVADYAVAMMLSAARHVPFMDRTMKEGNSRRPAGVELWQKTLGVLGTGRIGSGVIKRLQGFQMKTLCYDVYENEELKKDKTVSYTDLDTLIENSDFISIHTPLTKETENLFNKETFKRMRNAAVLVNTARGGIIDEESLYEALKEGEIGAAALDVTLETPYDGKLRELSNCILTPHAGAATVEASSKMSLMAAQNALSVLETGNCDFTVQAH
jgi:D-3-phosphoglycerate dehydrogenase